MNYINKLVKASIALIFSTLVACSSGADYCKKLESKVKNQNTQNILINWVKANVTEYNVRKSNLRPGGGVWPGEYELLLDFPWKEIGFSDDSQIRLVTQPGEKVYVNTISVLFAERSRVGILVKLRERGGFGIDETDLIKISNEIAIVCAL
jgi:hypothetical protein